MAADPGIFPGEANSNRNVRSEGGQEMKRQNMEAKELRSKRISCIGEQRGVE